MASSLLQIANIAVLCDNYPFKIFYGLDFAMAFIFLHIANVTVLCKNSGLEDFLSLRNSIHHTVAMSVCFHEFP